MIWKDETGVLHWDARAFYTDRAEELLGSAPVYLQEEAELIEQQDVEIVRLKKLLGSKRGVGTPNADRLGEKKEGEL